jgi:hypothetical protein
MFEAIVSELDGITTISVIGKAQMELGSLAIRRSLEIGPLKEGRSLEEVVDDISGEFEVTAANGVASSAATRIGDGMLITTLVVAAFNLTQGRHEGLLSSLSGNFFFKLFPVYIIQHWRNCIYVSQAGWMCGGTFIFGDQTGSSWAQLARRWHPSVLPDYLLHLSTHKSYKPSQCSPKFKRAFGGHGPRRNSARCIVGRKPPFVTSSYASRQILRN